MLLPTPIIINNSIIYKFFFDVFMTKRDKEIREDLEDKLYYNLYNPKDGVAQTNVNLSALYDIKTEKDLSL